MNIDNKPICDTDLIVKFCKCKKSNDLYMYYKLINFADAVYQELTFNSSNKSKKTRVEIEDFKNTLSDLNEKVENEKAKVINYHDLDKVAKNIIKKHLLKENIIYDELNKTYILQENLGEKVSIIYAAVLGIDIILSDDKGSRSFVKKFLRVNVIRLNDMLKELGYTDDEIRKNNFIANHKNAQYATEVLDYYGEHGNVKSFVDYSILSDYKEKYLRKKYKNKA